MCVRIALGYVCAAQVTIKRNARRYCVFVCVCGVPTYMKTKYIYEWRSFKENIKGIQIKEREIILRELSISFNEENSKRLLLSI